MLKKYGGGLVAFDDNPTTSKGDRSREERVIIWNFSSEKNAKAWHSDD